LIAGLSSSLSFKLTGVLFDLDGTLIDSASDICNSANFVLEKHGLSLYEIDQIRPLIGLPASEIFTSAGLSQDIEFAVKEFREHLGQTGGDPNIVYPGVLEGLDHLNKLSVPMAVATNKPTELAKIVLRRSGLIDYFSVVQGSDATKAKPAPDILIKAASEINSPISTTCMVGDTRVDIQASKAAGCFSVGVVYHDDFAQSMVNEMPDLLIRSVAEIIDFGEKNE
jgi:phosphoglycolate phosphatase